MSEFSAQLARRPTAPAPQQAPMPQGGAAGGASPLGQALAQVNQMLMEALQSGDIPPDAIEQIQQMAQIFAQLAGAGGRGQEAAPMGAPA